MSSIKVQHERDGLTTCTGAVLRHFSYIFRTQALFFFYKNTLHKTIEAENYKTIRNILRMNMLRLGMEPIKNILRPSSNKQGRRGPPEKREYK